MFLMHSLKEHQEKAVKIIFVLRITSIKITFLFVTDLIICVQMSPNIYRDPDVK